MGGRQKSGKVQQHLKAGGVTFGMIPICALLLNSGAIRKELFWRGMIGKTSRKDRKPIPSSSYPTITFECLCPISPPSILAIGLEVNNEPISWGLQFAGRSGVSPTARFWTEVSTVGNRIHHE